MLTLAMTQLTSWIGIASFVVCAALIIHAVSPWSSRGEPVKPQRRSLCIRFIVEATSLFIWLVWALPLLAWALVIGDNEHWFYRHAWILAIIVSVSIPGIATARIHRNGATARYLSLHLWLPLVLLVSFGAVFGYESLRSIEVVTPDSAAQEVFERLTPPLNEPVRFVEHVGELPHQLDPECCRSYWILSLNEPRGRFSIRRHKWFGWQFAHSEIFPPSVEELEKARKLLSDPINRDRAILVLRRVITNYPDTSAESEAIEMLESLDEPGE